MHVTSWLAPKSVKAKLVTIVLTLFSTIRVPSQVSILSTKKTNAKVSVLYLFVTPVISRVTGTTGNSNTFISFITVTGENVTVVTAGAGHFLVEWLITIKPNTYMYMGMSM